METALRGIGYCIVLPLILASSAVNILYGTTFSPGKLGIAFGIVFGLLDVLKSLLPILASGAFRHDQKLKGMVLWGLALALSGLALTSGHALYLTAAGEGMGDVTQAQERYVLARDSKKSIDDELTSLGKVRNSGDINGQIATKKLDALYTRSKNCKDATVIDSRALCQGIANLESELAKAIRAETLRGDLKAATEKLAGLNISKANQSANVQGELSGWLAIFIPILLELGCVFGLWALEKPMQKPDTLQQQEIAPEAPIVPTQEVIAVDMACNVARWAEAAVRRKAGEEILASDLYPRYRSACLSEDIKPETKQMFGRKMTILGYTTNKRGGKTRYENVAFRTFKPRLIAMNG